MAFGRLFDSRHGPFGEFQREINELFDSLASRYAGFGHGLLPQVFPPVNIFEDKDSVFVECELPGVDQNNLELLVTGDVLTLKGERTAPSVGEGMTLHIQERGYGAFNRAITLPVAVESDTAEAKFSNGMLQLRLAKAAAAKPRQVPVKVEE